MKNLKVVLCMLFLSLSGISVSASADDCDWKQYRLNTVSGGISVSFLCMVGEQTKATKKVTIPLKGQTSCSISTASGYTNEGSCTSPDIVKVPVIVVPKPCPIINIGMTCNGANYCSEAFGRKCYSYGGKTVWENSQMVCREKSC